MVFVAKINEATRVFQSELDDAKAKGFEDTVQKEAVATLMNRIIAKNSDIEGQPVSIRARLKARMISGGKPTTIDGFIPKLLRQGDIIADGCRKIGDPGWRKFRRRQGQKVGEER
jgi:hypothetical protein